MTELKLVALSKLTSIWGLLTTLLKWILDKIGLSRLVMVAYKELT